ncbi:hypothetical protein GGQ85_003974 [Nitrobacter vulgaris]|jgi:hypothetical protein|uniref:hypothetical protein n=1 Tax=Nitrobacter vulgaris TaxID=29421 RepID=UPI002859B1F7|nr:hypothetical protein [Nitrobacter vulgaris]MDR6306245.1 hypothetical protein [Nitrobacter vulgaris]
MSDDQIRALVEKNIFVANQNNKIVQSKSDEDAQIFMDSLFERHDVVWGVWQKEDGGIGMFPLKGDDVFREATETGTSPPLRMTAIVCSRKKGEAAQAARRTD